MSTVNDFFKTVVKCGWIYIQSPTLQELDKQVSRRQKRAAPFLHPPRSQDPLSGFPLALPPPPSCPLNARAISAPAMENCHGKTWLLEKLWFLKGKEAEHKGTIGPDPRDSSWAGPGGCPHYSLLM